MIIGFIPFYVSIHIKEKLPHTKLSCDHLGEDQRVTAINTTTSRNLNVFFFYSALPFTLPTTFHDDNWGWFLKVVATRRLRNYMHMYHGGLIPAITRTVFTKLLESVLRIFSRK